MDEFNFLKNTRRHIAEGELISNEDLQRVMTSVHGALAPPENTHHLVVATQLLANASVGHNINRLLCWKAFYPDLILLLSYTRNGDVMEPLCYALWQFAGDQIFQPAELNDACILRSIVEFYGSTQEHVSTTTFSLLLERVVVRIPNWTLEESFISALAKIDVECFSAKIITVILRGIFQRVEDDASHDALDALKNAASAEDAEIEILKEITHWTLRRLSSNRVSGGAQRIGQKTDLIALLCSLVERRPVIQNLVIDVNGLPLVLNCIRLDDQNPFLREWSLLFIRNISIDNSRAQDYIKSLERRQTAVDQTLGVTVEHDRATRTFTVRKS